MRACHSHYSKVSVVRIKGTVSPIFSVPLNSQKIYFYRWIVKTMVQFFLTITLLERRSWYKIIFGCGWLECKWCNLKKSVKFFKVFLCNFEEITKKLIVVYSSSVKLALIFISRCSKSNVVLREEVLSQIFAQFAPKYSQIAVTTPL